MLGRYYVFAYTFVTCTCTSLIDMGLQTYSAPVLFMVPLLLILLLPCFAFFLRGNCNVNPYLSMLPVCPTFLPITQQCRITIGLEFHSLNICKCHPFRLSLLLLRPYPDFPYFLLFSRFCRRSVPNRTAFSETFWHCIQLFLSFKFSRFLFYLVAFEQRPWSEKQCL